VEKPERLAYEKESLGLYVSEHPLDRRQGLAPEEADCRVAELERRRDGESSPSVASSGPSRADHEEGRAGWCSCGSTISQAPSRPSSSNSVYAAARDFLDADRVLVLKGRVDHKEGETKLIAIEVRPLRGGRRTAPRSASRLTRGRPGGLVRDLAELCRDYPGDAKVVAAIETSGGLGDPRIRVRTIECGPSPTFSPRSSRSSANPQSPS
jgi:DNA polymerase-3 subunit alpha